MQDIKGDGLVDLVGKKDNKDTGENYFVVRFNKGDSFDDKITKIERTKWNNFDVIDEQIEKAASEGFKEVVSAYSNGLNVDGSFLQDVGKSNLLGDAVNPFKLEDVINYSTGFSSSVSLTVSAGGQIYIFHISGSVGGSDQFSFNTSSIQFTDINGDGLPDHILQIAGQNKMQVITNEMGKVGLLKEVILPQGGKYEIEYDRVGNTTDMPQSRYVMSKVTRNNNREGFGVHKYETSFIYG